MGIEQIIQLIPGIIVGVIGYFLNKTLKGIDEKIKENDQKIEEVDTKLTKKIEGVGKELSDHKERVQRDFVTREDHAQSYGEISKKLDKIQDYIMQLLKERR